MDTFGYIYAVTVFVGGLMGYLKAGSVASLASGIAFGTLMGVAASRASRNPQDVQLAFGLSVTLFLVMGARFLNSGKVMPAGLVSILSLLMTIRYGQRLFS
ncbi:transmembrane protein 14C-like protein [Syncephalis fuscata]|nr:transmembrane protein 14C-like protein [Syncephalis fuscata]